MRIFPSGIGPRRKKQRNRFAVGYGIEIAGKKDRKFGIGIKITDTSGLRHPVFRIPLVVQVFTYKQQMSAVWQTNFNFEGFTGFGAI